jgi:hypothetical protein
MFRAVRMGLPYAKNGAWEVRITRCHCDSAERTLSVRTLITLLCDNIETHCIYIPMTLIIQNKFPLYVEFVPTS